MLYFLKLQFFQYKTFVDSKINIILMMFIKEMRPFKSTRIRNEVPLLLKWAGSILESRNPERSILKRKIKNCSGDIRDNEEFECKSLLGNVIVSVLIWRQ